MQLNPPIVHTILSDLKWSGPQSRSGIYSVAGVAAVIKGLSVIVPTLEVILRYPDLSLWCDPFLYSRFLTLPSSELCSFELHPHAKMRFLSKIAPECPQIYRQAPNHVSWSENTPYPANLEKFCESRERYWVVSRYPSSSNPKST